MQIKITQEGFESFTGFVANVEFKDGVSVGHVDALEAGTLGALYQVEEVTEEASEEVVEKTDKEAKEPEVIEKDQEEKVEAVKEEAPVETADSTESKAE